MSKINEKYAEMIKGIVYLTNELTEKKGELENIKKTIKQLKLSYNKEIKDYQLLNEAILSNESLLDAYNNKISKVNYKQTYILNSFNAEFYFHFYDIANNNNSIEALKLIFEFCSFVKPIDSIGLISIMQNEFELTALLSYSSITQIAAHRILRSDYELLKRKINDYIKDNKDKLNYPFDSLFEYISLIYEAIRLEEDKTKLERDFEAIVEQKNVKFLSLKSSEGFIIHNDALYKTTLKYIKGINGLLEKNQDKIKLQSDLQEMNNFLAAVDQFKSFVFATYKYDNMNNLSIQSEYSDNNSVDPSCLLLINKTNENSKQLQLTVNNSNTNGNGVAGNKNKSPNSNNNKFERIDINTHDISNIKIKKINTMTQFKKLDIVKLEENKGNRKNKIIETPPNAVHKPVTITSLMTDENNNDNENHYIKYRNVLTNNNNNYISYNLNKDSVCDEKITLSLNPKCINTGNYNNNSNQVIRKKGKAFYLEYEHLENDSKIPGCCQSCT